MRPSQKQITPEQLVFAQEHALVRIVDDEADLREALSFVLDMEGWKTVTYGRAEDFFTGDSPSEPGCVVLDVRMPGMSGIEAQHEMRSRGIALPIIFLTGHGDVDMAVGAVQDGAFDFLLKRAFSQLGRLCGLGERRCRGGAPRRRLARAARRTHQTRAFARSAHCARPHEPRSG